MILLFLFLNCEWGWTTLWLSFCLLNWWIMNKKRLKS